jgi:4-hydroxybenzoyl-CoA thioesterase
MIFQSEKMIRFHHCDPAGIVFFPQYLVLCHETIEDWIETGLAVGHANLLKVRRLGTPTVSLKCEFLAPSSFGEPLMFDLSVSRMGNSSLTLAIRAHRAGQVRMRAELVIVIMDLDSFRSVRIPEDLRALMQRYMPESGAG